MSCELTPHTVDNTYAVLCCGEGGAAYARFNSDGTLRYAFNAQEAQFMCDHFA